MVDSMTGQDAVNTTTFNDRLNFDGVVLTKLDGDKRWSQFHYSFCCRYQLSL